MESSDVQARGAGAVPVNLVYLMNIDHAHSNAFLCTVNKVGCF